MKNKLSKIFLFIILAMLINAAASFAQMPVVVDEPGFLTDAELEELVSGFEALRARYGVEVAVYIEDVMSASDAQNAADNIYDRNGYDEDGIMLYISRSPRNYQYTTSGYGITAFNDSGLEYIDNAVLPYLRDNDYYGALNMFMQKADELLKLDAEGTPYSAHDSTDTLIMIAIVLIAPVLVALFMTSAKQKKMKTAVSDNYANSYMKQGSMNLANSRDIFLYSVVNRREKPKSSSLSTTHTSSSGHTHGGRGGSY